MENSEAKNLSTIREELAALLRKTEELEKRISSLEADTRKETLPPGEPIDIMIDEVPFVVPNRRDELGIASPEPAPASYDSQEAENGESEIAEAPVAENGHAQEEKSEAVPAKKTKKSRTKANEIEHPAPKEAAAPAKVRAWMVDSPAAPLSNILSGIALKDRGIFINTLFREDPQLFIDTIGELNAMGNFAQAQTYIEQKFPEWNLDSDAVYRLMMAVRRKLN